MAASVAEPTGALLLQLFKAYLLREEIRPQILLSAIRRRKCLGIALNERLYGKVTAAGQAVDRVIRDCTGTRESTRGCTSTGQCVATSLIKGVAKNS
jgi:hypothetical protein